MTDERPAPISIYFPISRIDDDKREIEGMAFVSEVVPGEGGLRLKRSAMEAATPDYMEYANIRRMHQPDAVGVAKSVEWIGEGAKLIIEVVDDDAWNKVKRGVYKGLSVGVAATVMRGNDVEQCRWIETSLVDRPKDPDARILTYRVADMPEFTRIEQEEGAAAAAEATPASEAAVAPEPIAAAEEPAPDPVADPPSDPIAEPAAAEVVATDPPADDEPGDLLDDQARGFFGQLGTLLHVSAKDALDILKRAMTEKDVPARENLEGKTPKSTRADGKKPDGDYGDVKYADPGLQKDKKPRYPVDTKEHVQAALSYLGQKRNASKYSAEDLAKVQATINAAAKKFGIDVTPDMKRADMPPASFSDAIAMQQLQDEGNEALYVLWGILCNIAYCGGDDREALARQSIQQFADYIVPMVAGGGLSDDDGDEPDGDESRADTPDLTRLETLHTENTSLLTRLEIAAADLARVQSLLDEKTEAHTTAIERVRVLEQSPAPVKKPVQFPAAQGAERFFQANAAGAGEVPDGSALLTKYQELVKRLEDEPNEAKRQNGVVEMGILKRQYMAVTGRPFPS